MDNIVIASQWFQVTETFHSNGEISMFIMDTRDGDFVHGVVEDFNTHLMVWEELAANKAFGILPSVKARFLN